MLISQPAIWAGAAVWPRFGVSVTVVPAQPTAASATTSQARSRVDMLHLAVGLDGPSLDGVVMEDGVVAVVRDERVAFGLHGTRRVDRARFQHRRAATPLPGQVEGGDRARQHRR